MESVSVAVAVAVAVAGAGLAGLCLAQRLRRVGIDVRVYERDPGPFVRRQGYRITVDRDGLAALRDSLPAESYELALAAAGEPGGVFRITNSRLRDAVKLTFPATEDSGRQMDRQVLRSILLKGLDERVHYGRTAVAVEQGGGDGRAGAGAGSGGVEQSGGHLVLRFADGTAVRAGAVVGADGIGSALRPLVAPDADPADSGVSGIYGRTPLLPDMVPDALHKSGVLAVGDEPGRAFFFTTMRFGPAVPADDYVMWGLVLRREEVPAGDSPRLTKAAKRLAAGFHPLVGRLVEGADDEATIVSDFAVGRRPERWPIPRATMLGDAVHAMPPFGAHGGNTALRDAALLGGKLASGGSVPAAITAYQTEMAEYAFQAVDSSARMMRRLTATKGFQKWVMTRVLPRFRPVTVP